MWLYSFILKLFPCLVLTILTACLIQALYKVSHILCNQVTHLNSLQVDADSQKLKTGSNADLNIGRQNSRSKSTDKTTKLLSAVLILFLVTEFPQVI